MSISHSLASCYSHLKIFPHHRARTSEPPYTPLLTDTVTLWYFSQNLIISALGQKEGFCQICTVILYFKTTHGTMKRWSYIADDIKIND